MDQHRKVTQAFSAMAPRYEEVLGSELQRFWGWGYEEFIDLIQEGSAINEDDRVLDIATGTGSIPERLVKEGKSHRPIHGLDITLSMLAQARSRFERMEMAGQVFLVCASAMEMPYANGSFTYVICGLATHHMSVEILLLESCRLLQQGGRLTMADAGGAPSWKIPGVKLLLKLAAFIYFCLSEDFTRAWIEAGAVSNVRTKEQWFTLLETMGFEEIDIDVMESKHDWISAPLLIRAVKS